MPTGIEVKVEFNDLVIVGEILNQRAGELGRYRIGVRIREVVRSHEARGLVVLDKALGQSRSPIAIPNIAVTS